MAANTKGMKTYLGLAAALLAGYLLYQTLNGLLPGGTPEPHASPSKDGAAVLADAFAQRRSDLQVAGSGRVAKLLPDDTRGSRHQRFILELASGQTLLVAHNIDLAPRIPSLAVGDRVRFYGEYEWNSQGGVLHWTHHDPDGTHAHGWLEHDGRRYQ